MAETLEQLYYHVILRHDTEAIWLAENPVLLAGEGAWVTDKQYLKFGDGVNPFSQLSKFSAGGGSGGVQGTVSYFAAQTNFPVSVNNIIYTVEAGKWIYDGKLQLINGTDTEALVSVFIQDSVTQENGDILYNDFKVNAKDGLIVSELNLTQNQVVVIKTTNKDIAVSLYGQVLSSDHKSGRLVKTATNGASQSIFNATVAVNNAYCVLSNTNAFDVEVKLYVSDVNTVVAKDLVRTYTIPSNKTVITDMFVVPQNYFVNVNSGATGVSIGMWGTL